jgi:hypothetical protein
MLELKLRPPKLYEVASSVFDIPDARSVWPAPSATPRLGLAVAFYRPTESIGGSMENEGTKKAPETEKRPTLTIRGMKTRTRSSKEGISRITKNTKNRQSS